MEINGKVHCFFEQSGTFKNEFIKLGIPAEDYDIKNQFGQTDHVIDLFAEIDKAYNGSSSLFDYITKDDLILSFFPCIYFCENNQLYFTGNHHNLSKLSIKDKSDLILERSRKRQYFYEICLQLFTVCDIRGLRLIVENPYASQHFLVGNFPYKSTVIDFNRRLRGDYYKKPTQFWFINCSSSNLCSIQTNKFRRTIASSKSGTQSGICSEERSMISQDYARNFICDFILGKFQKNTLLTFDF